MINNSDPFSKWDKKTLNSPDKSDPFDKWKSVIEKPKLQEKPKEESNAKSLLRYALQIPQGLAESTAPGIIGNIWQLLASGEVLDPNEIEHLKMISEREGIPFNEEKFNEAGQKALSAIPTVSNISRLVEEKTGIPLEAKTQGQKLLKMGTTAQGFAPSLSQKVVAGVASPSINLGLQKLGVPEPIAEVIGYSGGGLAAAKTPSIDLVSKTRSSGLPVRRFENVESPTNISQGRMNKINQSLENDFKNISEKIIEKSPYSETRKSFNENPLFKQDVAEQFQVVQDLAENVPGKTNTSSLKNRLKEIVKDNKKSSLLNDEYQLEYDNEVNKLIKQTGDQEASASDLVRQYRKNNKSLSEYYDPSRTKAYNRAKKDAILDYNRSIADIIQSEYPNTEFSKLFPETNKNWAKVLDAEAIEDFISGMTDGKLNYKSAKKFLDNDNLARPFKRSLGEEGFNEFKELMKDILQTEKPYNMLKIAKNNGFNDLVSSASSYLLNPKLALAKIGYKTAKKSINDAFNVMLDKPQMVFKVKKGFEELNKGHFNSAENIFSEIK